MDARFFTVCIVNIYFELNTKLKNVDLYSYSAWTRSFNTIPA